MRCHGNGIPGTFRNNLKRPKTYTKYGAVVDTEKERVEGEQVLRETTPATSSLHICTAFILLQTIGIDGIGLGILAQHNDSVEAMFGGNTVLTICFYIAYVLLALISGGVTILVNYINLSNRKKTVFGAILNFLFGAIVAGFIYCFKFQPNYVDTYLGKGTEVQIAKDIKERKELESIGSHGFDPIDEDPDSPKELFRTGKISLDEMQQMENDHFTFEEILRNRKK